MDEQHKEINKTTAVQYGIRFFALSWYKRNTTTLTAEEIILYHRNIGAVTGSATYLHNAFESPHEAILCKLLELSKVRYHHDARKTKVAVPECGLIIYFWF
jgi:hypothetical protein